MQYNFKDKSERRRFYKSNAWRGVNGVRNQVVKRDGNECVWCKRDGKVTTSDMAILEVDHIKELEHCTYTEAIDLNNLRTLCRSCHNKRHNRFDGQYKSKRKFINEERW